jgi:hypothetical protein
MDFVAFAENERCHFRIPESGLVAEMNASLEHLAHAYCRHS